MKYFNGVFDIEPYQHLVDPSAESKSLEELLNAIVSEGVLNIGGSLTLTSPTFFNTSPATISTADAVTLTAAQVLSRMILRDPAGDDRTDTTPTAEALVAAISGATVGNSLYLTIRNTADAAETITIEGGTGVTISGTATIAQNIRSLVSRAAIAVLQRSRGE